MIPESPFFHAHAHSRFSPLDGMTDVRGLVQKAAANKQPALALTDHGLMSGIVQLYQACKEFGIKPYPGIEAYLIDPEFDDWENPPKGAKVGRYHVCLLALSEEGYKALVKFTSKTHTRPRFNRFPRCTISDLAELGKESGEHIALLTGCYFGWLQQTLINDGPVKAAGVLRTYKSFFPNTFVEIQHHNIVHDTEDGKVMDDNDMVEALIELADDADLPVVATQDSHYTDHGQKPAHAFMKQLTYGGDDNEFPGDSFHLASTEWVQEHYTEEQWERALEGSQMLLDLNTVKITPLDKFEADVPKVKGIADPIKHIQTQCRIALSAKIKSGEIPMSQRKAYEARLHMETDTIIYLKMAAYFCIWEKFVQWCRDNDIAIEARGSANGSLVCWLLGITQVDAVRWDTMFARFLSKDRIKPPDIDMDIEDVERLRAVHYMLSLYNSVQIGTFSKLGISVNEEGQEVGSVMRTWQSSKRRECEEIAHKRWEEGKLDKKGDIKRYAQGIFNRKYAGIENIDDVRQVSQREYEGLRAIDEMGTVYRSYGVHAGGVLLSGQKWSIDDYIPTMLVASSNTRVSQYDMDDVEQFGLLKMDLLGQAALHTMKVANQLIGEASDSADFAWIPEDDNEACKALRSGRTGTGIFHQEGYTKSRGFREMKVRNTMDSVLGQALYMPGCMDVAPGLTISQKDLYLSRRNSAQERRNITYLHPAFEKALSSTHGAVVFQEQVIQIMRGLGMDIEGINIFFKVVKDSGRGASERNQERMRQVREQFDSLCRKAGIDSEEAWKQTASFVTYGFNRAHATGYGIRSYRTAYMKAHYPLQYMSGLLESWSGTKKEAMYIKEARRVGIRILPPDVNISKLDWTMDEDRNAIRKGLLSITGIGVPTGTGIADGAPYSSIEEMVKRLPARVLTGGKAYLTTGEMTGNLAKLRDAGALDSITNRRNR